MQPMQTIRQTCARHKLWLGLAALLAVGAAVLAWAGYDLSARVDDRPVYEIVNDHYSQTLELPQLAAGESAAAAGLVQQLALPAGKTIYGLRLDFATYGYAFAGGTLTARLETPGGLILAEGSLPCVTIKDNTFAPVVFAQPYTAGAAAETLLLRLWYTAPGEESHPLGLWASEGEADGLPLWLGGTVGQRLNATAAMQFITDYSGNVSKTLSLLLGGLLLAGLAAAYLLLFAPRRRLLGAFAAVGLCLGTAFALVTPPLVAPDEYTHLAQSYRLASVLLGQQPTTEKEDTLYLNLRPCDAPYFRDNTGEIGIFAYKQMLGGLTVTGQSGDCTVVSDYAVQTGTASARLYWGQPLGMALARALGLGFYGMLLLGRLANLLIYLALGALALWLAPERVKGLFACVLLLPMALQLAGSLSGDSLVLGLVFGYTALCLRLRALPVPARPAGIVLLVLYAMAIAPLKAIYLPVVLLCLWVPPQTLGWGRVPGRVFQGLAIGLAALCWAGANLGAVAYATRDVDNVGLTRAAVAAAVAALLLWALYRRARKSPRGKKLFFGSLALLCCAAVPVAVYKLTHMWGGLTPAQIAGGIQPNGDSIYTYSFGYICRNLPATVKLLLRSAESQGAAWLQGVVGTALGEPIVYPVAVSWVLSVAIVLVLAAAALRQTGEPPRLPGRRLRWGTALVLLCVVGLSVLAALTWTPINYETVFGVQGRYWLPVLPLALLLLGENGALGAQRNCARGTVFAMSCLTSVVLLQGCGIYAAWGLQ